MASTPLAPPRKSPNDPRLYQALRLSNELTVLLIHDADAQKSSAALSMGVGSFKDPSNAFGLAHYLEHMLFMGTEKYPDENDYSNFITKNAGSNNAYTSQEETNYMLQVSSTAFEPALDRFAQFFIAPLLSEKSAEKQINAVDSEHQKNILNDSWRKYQLSKHLAKDGHPFNKFSTGNKETLKCDNLQAMLADFYKTNYSANLMNLVIYGQQPLDVMQKWAVQKFSQIPNQKLVRFGLSEQPFGDKAFGKLIKLVPVKDTKKLLLTWILPNKKEHYKHSPGRIISNLIGHEGKGSILSLLMKLGLATTVNSGCEDSFNCYTEFEMSIDLTDEGLKNIQKIIGYIFYYIQMLKEKGVPKQFFEQLQLINKLKFQFLDKKKGMMESAKIAKNMHDRTIQQLFVYPYLMEDWRPDLVQQFLSEMTPANLFVFCEAREFQESCNLEEPVYKTKYSSQDLTVIAPIQCDVSLPDVNIFLPKDLNVLPLQTENLPEIVYKSDFFETFFKQDHIFKLPKANINMRLIFNGNYSVIDEIGRAVLLDMLKEQLREFVYLAEMAEIQTEASFVSFISFQIKFKGFRDSLKLFVVQYIKRIFDFVPTNEQLFNTLIQKHRRKYANYFLEDPYRLAYGKLGQSLRTNQSPSQAEKLIQIQNLTLEKVAQLNKQWKKKLLIESYFGGNITKQQTLFIVSGVEAFLKTHSKPHKRHQTGQLRTVLLQPNLQPAVEQSLHNDKQANSALAIHFQTGQLTIRQQLLLKLTESVVKEPAFDYLRTQQQLGYIVFCLAEDNRGAGGISIIVQSAVKGTHQIVEYVQKFLSEKLNGIIQGLTEEVFEEYKTSLRNTKAEKDKNLASETLRFWSQIVKHKYIFNRKEQELETLPTITLQEFKKFVNTHFYTAPKRLQLHMTSSSKIEANTHARNLRAGKVTIFDEPDKFTRTMPLFPDFYAPRS